MGEFEVAIWAIARVPVCPCGQVRSDFLCCADATRGLPLVRLAFLHRADQVGKRVGNRIRLGAALDIL